MEPELESLILDELQPKLQKDWPFIRSVPLGKAISTIIIDSWGTIVVKEKVYEVIIPVELLAGVTVNIL